MSDDGTHHAAAGTPERTGGDWMIGAGGWGNVRARAAALVDDPELIALTHTVVEDEPPVELAAEVHNAVVDALAQCSSPTIFRECLAALLGNSTVLETAGSRLYDICLERTRIPVDDAGPQSWLVAADALEGATRIALGGWVPHFAVLAYLTRLPPVIPPILARAALRCLAAAYERWRESALVTAIEQLAGVAPATIDTEVDQATVEEWAHEIGPDAAYELGCASLLQALGGDTVADVEEHLRAADRRLSVAVTARVDAAAMTDVVRLLAAHLPTDAGRATFKTTDLAALADRLERHVREHVLGYSGFVHWRSPRLDAELAWARLAHDVARTHAALTEPTWYQAGTVLADVLAAYTASRCSRVLCRQDREGIQAILGPSIESGIAVKAGLMKHLEDHIQALEAQENRVHAEEDGQPEPTNAAFEAELTAARSLLDAARDQLSWPEHPPKPLGSAAAVSPDGPAALPLLHTMLHGDTAALASLPPEVVQRIEMAIAESHEATGVGLPSADSLIIEETLARLQRDLSNSPHYRHEVKTAVDEVLVLLLRFWRSRDGFGATKMPYLFDPDAIEENLADDLNLWFDGTPHTARTATEVRHVGGGRVDVACIFPRFTLYIELKKDDRNIDVAEMRRYLLQTGGYQSADVPIGFLAVLDLHTRTGPTPHLSSCFRVVVLDEPGLGAPRYIVTMVVPGNRTKPSLMR